MAKATERISSSSCRNASKFSESRDRRRGIAPTRTTMLWAPVVGVAKVVVAPAVLLAVALDDGDDDDDDDNDNINNNNDDDNSNTNFDKSTTKNV